MLLLAVVVTILGGFSAISGFQAKPSLSLGAASTSDNAAAVSAPGSGIVLTVPPQTTGPAYCRPQDCSVGNHGCYWDPVACDCECSPIIIDVEGQGFHLTDVDDGVMFDIRAEGVKRQMAWTRAGAGNAFLGLDRNGNGIIDDGSELFGSLTPQPKRTIQMGSLPWPSMTIPRMAATVAA